jgi:hypothetical protein
MIDQFVEKRQPELVGMGIVMGVALYLKEYVMFIWP